MTGRRNDLSAKQMLVSIHFSSAPSMPLIQLVAENLRITNAAIMLVCKAGELWPDGSKQQSILNY